MNLLAVSRCCVTAKMSHQYGRSSDTWTFIQGPKPFLAGAVKTGNSENRGQRSSGTKGGHVKIWVATHGNKAQEAITSIYTRYKDMVLRQPCEITTEKTG